MGVFLVGRLSGDRGMGEREVGDKDRTRGPYIILHRNAVPPRRRGTVLARFEAGSSKVSDSLNALWGRGALRLPRVAVNAGSCGKVQITINIK